MNTRLIIADMTAHRRGFGVQPIIDAAARRTQTAQNVRVLWMVPSHLTTAFGSARGFGSNSEIRICDTIGQSLLAVIEQEIDRVISEEPGVEILVVTWDQLIYAGVRNAARRVSTAKWFDLLDGGRMASPQPAIPAMPAPVGASSVPSSEYLMPMVISYLKSLGATSEERALYRSQLRPALVKAIPDLRPIAKHPLFGSNFKTALDVAIDSKVIREERLSPGKERIWVDEPAVVTEAKATVEFTAEVEPAPALATPPTFCRTAQFRKRLTDLGIYCEKRDRDVLMDALKDILASGGIMISRLRRELPKKARQLADQRAVCTKTDFKRIANFFIKLMLMTGVITREDGKPVQRDAGADGTTVTGLVGNATIVAETYLLEQILKANDVEDREQWQLAHVLFREFDTSVSLDDKLDQVALMIRDLSSRVVLSENGKYEYTGNHPTGIRPIRAAQA
jgi:hypothetical protein